MEIIINHKDYVITLNVGSGNDVAASIRTPDGRHVQNYLIDRTKYERTDTLIAGIQTFAQQLYTNEVARFGNNGAVVK